MYDDFLLNNYNTSVFFLIKIMNNATHDGIDRSVSWFYIKKNILKVDKNVVLLQNCLFYMLDYSEIAINFLLIYNTYL